MYVLTLLILSALGAVVGFVTTGGSMRWAAVLSVILFVAYVAFYPQPFYVWSYPMAVMWLSFVVTFFIKSRKNSSD